MTVRSLRPRSGSTKPSVFGPSHHSDVARCVPSPTSSTSPLTGSTGSTTNGSCTASAAPHQPKPKTATMPTSEPVNRLVHRNPGAHKTRGSSQTCGSHDPWSSDIDVVGDVEVNLRTLAAKLRPKGSLRLPSWTDGCWRRWHRSSAQRRTDRDRRTRNFPRPHLGQREHVWGLRRGEQRRLRVGRRPHSNYSCTTRIPDLTFEAISWSLAPREAISRPSSATATTDTKMAPASLYRQAKETSDEV